VVRVEVAKEDGTKALGILLNNGKFIVIESNVFNIIQHPKEAIENFRKAHIKILKVNHDELDASGAIKDINNEDETIPTVPS